MTKIIRIEGCSKCPHNDHMGGYGSPKYVPICRLARKSQPYEIAADERFGSVARQTVAIPDWCPLEELESQSGEVVYWESRFLDCANNPDGVWTTWERVVPRNPYTDTVDDRVAEFRHYIANGYKYELRPLYLRAPQSSETLTDSYVQQVPDKCDRIIWRGHYYHLDNLRAPQAVPEGE